MPIQWNPFDLQRQKLQGEQENTFMRLLGGLVETRMRQNMQQRELELRKGMAEEQGRAQMAQAGWTPGEGEGAQTLYGQQMVPPQPRIAPLQGMPNHYLVQVGDKNQVIKQDSQYDMDIPNVGSIRVPGESLLNFYSHTRGAEIAANAQIRSAEIRQNDKEPSLTITTELPGLGRVSGKPGELNSLKTFMGIQDPMSQESWYSKAQTELGRQFGTLTDKGFVVDPENMKTYQEAGQHLEPLRTLGIDPVKATIWSRALAENTGKVATSPYGPGGSKILSGVPTGSVPIGRSRTTGKTIYMTPQYKAVDEQGNEIPW